MQSKPIDLQTAFSPGYFVATRSVFGPALTTLRNGGLTERNGHGNPAAAAADWRHATVRRGRLRRPGVFRPKRRTNFHSQIRNWIDRGGASPREYCVEPPLSQHRRRSFRCRGARRI
jgi:hypothetical protein